MKKLALHWQILIGMLLGLIFGFVMLQFDWGVGFVNDWIKPLGTIFVKLLKSFHYKGKHSSIIIS